MAVVPQRRAADVVGSDTRDVIRTSMFGPPGLQGAQGLWITAHGLRLQPVRPDLAGELLPEEVPLPPMLLAKLGEVGLAGARGQRIERLSGEPVAPQELDRGVLETARSPEPFKLHRLALPENGRLGRPCLGAEFHLVLVAGIQDGRVGLGRKRLLLVPAARGHRWTFGRMDGGLVGPQALFQSRL